MPAWMQGSPILMLLGVAPLITMMVWLFRTRRIAKQTMSRPPASARAQPG